MRHTIAVLIIVQDTPHDRAMKVVHDLWAITWHLALFIVTGTAFALAAAVVAYLWLVWLPLGGLVLLVGYIYNMYTVMVVGWILIAAGVIGCILRYSWLSD